MASQNDPPKSMAVFKPDPNAADFHIYHRDKNGKPDKQYPPNDSMATLVVRSINICRGMLEQENTQEAFTELAREYVEERPNAWFIRRRPNREEKLKEFTEIFIKKVLHRFPSVFVDDTFTNPDVTTAHPGHEWDGEIRDFETSDQCILINAKRLTHMHDKAILAQGPYEYDSQDHTRECRAFLFMFANALLHEIGHMYMTCLTHGREEPPSTMRPRKHESFEALTGEPGDILEFLIFGGILNFVNDPDVRTRHDDCGTPYLDKGTGNYHRIEQDVIEKTISYHIDQETINKTVHLNFELSYPHSDLADPRRLTTLGADMPADKLTSPFLHEDWEALRAAPPPTDP